MHRDRDRDWIGLGIGSDRWGKRVRKTAATDCCTKSQQHHLKHFNKNFYTAPKHTNAAKNKRENKKLKAKNWFPITCSAEPTPKVPSPVSPYTYGNETWWSFIYLWLNRPLLAVQDFQEVKHTYLHAPADRGSQYLYCIGEAFRTRKMVISMGIAMCMVVWYQLW